MDSDFLLISPELNSVPATNTSPAVGLQFSNVSLFSLTSVRFVCLFVLRDNGIIDIDNKTLFALFFRVS